MNINELVGTSSFPFEKKDPKPDSRNMVGSSSINTVFHNLYKICNKRKQPVLYSQDNRLSAISVDYRLLQEASRSGDLNTVKAFIESSGSSKILANYLGVLLQMALSNGHLDIAKALIESNRFSEISANCLGVLLQKA